MWQPKVVEWDTCCYMTLVKMVHHFWCDNKSDNWCRMEGEEQRECLPSFLSLSLAGFAAGGDLDFSLLVCCFDDGDDDTGPPLAACIGALSSRPWSLPPITGFQPRPVSISFPLPFPQLIATLFVLPLTEAKFSALFSVVATPVSHPRSFLLGHHTYSSFRTSCNSLSLTCAPLKNNTWIHPPHSTTRTYSLH